jgi:hypothetical protein
LPVEGFTQYVVRDMQWILGIDLSAHPCEISLSSVEGNLVEVTAHKTVDLPILADTALLSRSDITPILTALTKKKDGENAEESNEIGDEAEANEPLAGRDKEEVDTDKVRLSVQNLKDALQSFEAPWTAVSVIIPPHDHLALNLNLPFGDAKNLNRIVDLEVQDVVPFELDDFLVQYAPLGPMSQGAAAFDIKESVAHMYDVHVGLMPRAFVKNILEFCKAAGIEPNILTVPSSALGSVYHLGRDFFTSNSAVIFNRGDEYSMAVFINGEVRVERVLYASKILAGTALQPGEHPLRPVFTALKLMLAAAERRYGVRVENVYILGRDIKSSNLQQLFGRPIQGVHLKDFIKTGDAPVGLSPLSVPFAADDTTLAPLSNFRAREFSFTPKIAEFLRALLGASKYIQAAVGAVIISLACIYSVRAYNLSSIESSLQRQIALVIPNFQVPADGDIRGALMKAEGKLTEELGVLASPAKVSPLDALLEIMRLLPTDDGVTILNIKITNTTAKITGTAPQLSSIENIGKALRANKGVFSKVTATPGSSNASKFNFTVDLVLSQ